MNPKRVFRELISINSCFVDKPDIGQNIRNYYGPNLLALQSRILFLSSLKLMLCHRPKFWPVLPKF